MQTESEPRDTILAPAVAVAFFSGAPPEALTQATEQSTKDRILAGMVRAGLVREAICAFLTLNVAVLDSELDRLGLTAPSDRPMRKPSGKRPWLIVDVQFLIARWAGHIHPESIGLQLGRSAGAVRAKARRLGLYRRSRRDLIKVGLLPDQVSGAVTTRHAESEIVIEVGEIALRPAASHDHLEDRCGQGRIANRKAKVHGLQRIVWNSELDLEIARRWLAWQCHKGIARDMRLTPAQVRSRATRMGLPSRSHDRAKIVEDYVKGRAYNRSLETTGSMKWCSQGNMHYFAYRNGPRTSPKFMKTKKYRELRSGCGEEYSFG